MLAPTSVWKSRRTVKWIARSDARSPRPLRIAGSALPRDHPSSLPLVNEFPRALPGYPSLKARNRGSGRTRPPVVARASAPQARKSEAGRLQESAAGVIDASGGMRPRSMAPGLTRPGLSLAPDSVPAFAAERTLKSLSGVRYGNPSGPSRRRPGCTSGESYREQTVATRAEEEVGTGGGRWGGKRCLTMTNCNRY